MEITMQEHKKLTMVKAGKTKNLKVLDDFCEGGGFLQMSPATIGNLLVDEGGNPCVGPGIGFPPSRE